MSVNTADLGVIAERLRRKPRGIVDISCRGLNGTPGVVKTKPRSDDGTPLLTLFYLTDPQLTAEASRLETTNVMKEMIARLENGAKLATDYQHTHEAFLAEHNEMEDLGTDFSGGGIPTRVKCLHVLIACALAKESGHFRLGTESVALAAENEKPRGITIPVNWPTIAKFGIAHPGVEG